MGNIRGQVALVTGASRGIGQAIAMELGCRGARVAVNYRASHAEAEDTAAQIRANGSECILVQGDVSTPEEAERVVKAVIDKWGRLDILVNNAGITRDKTLKRMSTEDWVTVINVNLNGTFYTTHAALPYMMEQQYGRIVNISSMNGQTSAFGQANYAASKGGIIAFTKTLAVEVARYNITANTVAPGFTLTDMLMQVPMNIQEQIKTKIPMGRFGSPEEIAKAVGFLVTEGDYITGQQINVNGGAYV